MNITNSKRLSRLLSNLWRNPALVIPYIKSNLLRGKKLPAEMGYPWWSYHAIERADQLFPGRSIFEWGTGGTTVRYGLVASRMMSIEDDAIWMDKVRGFLPAECAAKVSLQLHPFDFQKPMGFESSGYLMALSDPGWDVIIIDGQDWTFCERITCFKHAERLVRPGAIIVLDDYWRYQAEIESFHHAKTVEIHESVGPCRFGVTSTAFFFY